MLPGQPALQACKKRNVSSNINVTPHTPGFLSPCRLVWNGFPVVLVFEGSSAAEKLWHHYPTICRTQATTGSNPFKVLPTQHNVQKN